ncbi:MAG: hypothetical protein JXA67_18835 [Micromonosporaceae bacterium]|nr:hypothetical protein [Micromonosporaceae bacterium]
MHREPDRLDAATAESLLSRRPVTDHDRLARLLAAVAAPAGEDELRRQVATRVAFLHARQHPLPTWKRRLSMIKTTLAKLMTMKIAALGLAVGGVGGVAVAATTGNLPDPIQRHVPGSTAQFATGSAGPSMTPERSAPPYSLLDACRRYQERDRTQRHTALRNEAEFSELVAHLGGPDQERADAFCTDLRRAWPSATPGGQTPNTPASPQPSPQRSGGNGPAGAPGSTAGQPSNHASTGTPSNQPSNRSASPRR